MPPDEPKLAQVIPLPVRRRPSVRKAEPSPVQVSVPDRKRGKGRLMVVGALLLGSLWLGLEMAVESIDDEGAPVAEDSSEDWSPFQPSSEPAERDNDDLAGSAWYSTTGGGQGRR